MTKIPNLLDEAAGSAVAEKSERQKSVHARLTRAMPDVLRQYPTLPPLSESDRSNVVYAVLAAISGQGWRVYENQPMCCACRDREAERNTEQTARLRDELRDAEQRIADKTADIYFDGTGI